jgi:hypothetical protein
LSLQRLQFDIFEPGGTTVVLQADVALARVLFVSDVEFVRAPIGTLVRLGEFVEIRTSDKFVIEHDFNDPFVAGEFDVVPFAHWFHRVASAFHQVINRTGIMKSRAGRVIDGDLTPCDSIDSIAALSR